MARGGDGVSFRGTTWWLDFTNAFLSTHPRSTAISDVACEASTARLSTKPFGPRRNRRAVTNQLAKLNGLKSVITPPKPAFIQTPPIPTRMSKTARTSQT